LEVGHNTDDCNDSGTADEVYTHSANGHSNDELQILKGMFPALTETTLSVALASAGNDMNMAVDLIVSDYPVNPDSAVDETSSPSKYFIKIVS